MTYHAKSPFITDDPMTLRQKSKQLTGFLELVLQAVQADEQLFRLITPNDPEARGCQLSLLTDQRGKQLFQFLEQNGVMADWREPNVIRFAPVPLYNSFEDMWRLGELIRVYQLG